VWVAKCCSGHAVRRRGQSPPSVGFRPHGAKLFQQSFQRIRPCRVSKLRLIPACKLDERNAKLCRVAELLVVTVVQELPALPGPFGVVLDVEWIRAKVSRLDNSHVNAKGLQLQPQPSA